MITGFRRLPFFFFFRSNPFSEMFLLVQIKVFCLCVASLQSLAAGSLSRDSWGKRLRQCSRPSPVYFLFFLLTLFFRLDLSQKILLHVVCLPLLPNQPLIFTPWNNVLFYLFSYHMTLKVLQKCGSDR